MYIMRRVYDTTRPSFAKKYLYRREFTTKSVIRASLEQICVPHELRESLSVQPHEQSNGLGPQNGTTAVSFFLHLIYQIRPYCLSPSLVVISDPEVSASE